MDDVLPKGDVTELFLGLTPEKVLEAVERAGLETHPVCYPLNSFENRVYEVELADRTRIVAKFYRPGRWSVEQILEEHDFLDQLVGAEIPVCGVSRFPDGGSIETIEGIHYSLWERRGGRAPDELSDEDLLRLGMFIGRMHSIGAENSFKFRPRLDADRYVRRQMTFLEREKVIPKPFEKRYLEAAETIADLADRELLGTDYQRLHGDLHLGNILFRDHELRVLDFDDACSGPPVQDLWLAVPGRDDEARRRRGLLIEGYERFRIFDWTSLRWIEILRGLRLVRYCGWLARRWNDPAFRMGWPQFGTEEYWQTETSDLEEQLGAIQKGLRESASGAQKGVSNENLGARLEAESEAELTNKDFFWDWEGD